MHAWGSVASGALPLKPQAEKGAHKGRVVVMLEATTADQADGPPTHRHAEAPA
jgi:hypothetical protein